MATEHVDQTQDVRLSLVPHGLARPEALLVAARVVEREGQGDDLREQVLDQTCAQAEGMLNELSLKRKKQTHARGGGEGCIR